jgi:uncharacterized RDD family membrane protein YckC
LAGLLPPPLPGAASPVAPGRAVAEGGFPREKNAAKRAADVARAADWLTTPAYAWRRFFARQLDALTVGVGVMMLIGVVISTSDSGAAFLSNPGSEMILGIVGITLATLPNAIILAATGRSIGKLVFGVRVRTPSGETPSLMQTFNREIRVTAIGIFFGVPIFTLIAMGMSYQTVQRRGITQWDEDLGLVVTYRPPSTVHGILFALGIVLIVVLVAGLTALGQANV